jgi:hypothetical protein
MAQTITGDAAVTSATQPNNVGTDSTIDSIGAGKTAQNPDQSLTVDRNQLTQWTLDQLQRLRNFRRPYDQRRAYFYRQYIGQRDRRLFPDNITPRSNTFVPYASSNVETVVSRVSDAFFSLDPPIEVRAKGGSDDSASKMQLVVLDCLKRAKWMYVIEQMVRDICIYGHSGLKVDWDWDYDTVMGPEPVFAMQPMLDPSTGGPKVDPLTQQPIMIPVLDPDGNKIQIGTNMISKQVPRNCPKLIPIDIYDLLIDPDGKMKCHVMEMSWGEMRRSAETNPKLYYPEALAELTRRLSQYKDLDRDGVIIRMAELWDDTRKTVTLVTFGEDADAIGWKDRRYQYRNASYSAYKRRVYNGPPVLLYTGPNPFAHKRIPILDCPYIKVKGDTWGIGLIEKISDLNEAVNVFTNMITDNWNVSINRRFAYDVQVDIDHDQLDQGNVPGGKIGVVGDPSKAIYPLPNFTPNPQDYQIIDLYRGMIEMSSGISELATGLAQANGTASGISQVINESGYVFKLFIRNFEIEVLQPMCEMVASMIQQFGTNEMEYSITNAPPGIPKYGQVKLKDLIGNYSFDFVAANYATGKVVKQRNMMAFYNIAMQSPYLQQGEFLREIAKCMEIPYAQRLLKSDQEVQQNAAAQSQAALQQEVIKDLLRFESKALVAGIAKKEPNQGVTDHAMLVQEEVERFLMEQAGLPIDDQPPLPGRSEGNQNHSGNIETPGGDMADHLRGFSQQHGGNTLGAG